MVCGILSKEDKNSLLQKRFLLVSAFGGSIAIFGIIANAFLAVLFLSKKNFRHSPYFFLGFVALFDTLLDTVYVMLMCIPVLAEFFDIKKLYLIWISYARTTYLFGQVFKISSVLCLIHASLERYTLTRHWTFTGFEYKTRWILLICAVSSAFFLKMLTSHDIVIVFQPECDFYNRINVGQISKNNFLSGFLTLATTFIPFCTLIFLNGGTVIMLKKQNIQQLRSLITRLTLGQDVMEMRRKNLKAATHTLLFIITAYLISNLLNLIISIIEFIYPDLVQIYYPYIYRLVVDLASVMTIIGNAIRFPAHLFSNTEIRNVLLKNIKNTEETNIVPDGRRPSHVDSPWFSLLYAEQPYQNNLSSRSYEYIDAHVIKIELFETNYSVITSFSISVMK
uniref:G_PROTEIN_RECEP_F1_2 domain-containing protein n=1 Tax=Strongyloides stercoralis TaxID=6248 RepID=A0A0K0EMB0_STRER